MDQTEENVRSFVSQEGSLLHVERDANWKLITAETLKALFVFHTKAEVKKFTCVSVERDGCTAGLPHEEFLSCYARYCQAVGPTPLEQIGHVQCEHVRMRVPLGNNAYVSAIIPIQMLEGFTLSA